MNNQEQLYDLMNKYFNQFLVIRRKSSAKTLKTYKASINKFRKYMDAQKGIPFLSLELSNFGKDFVFDFLVYLRDNEHLKASTLNLRLAALKSFTRFCSEEEPVATSIYISLTKIRKFKDPDRTTIVEYLKQDQLKLLFSMPDTTTRQGRRDQFIMIFMYETGARISEFLNIRLKDILEQSSTTQVRLHGKGNKVRYIPITDDAMNHLQSYLEEFHLVNDPEDYLVYTIHHGEHTKMTAGTVNHLLKKYATAAIGKDPNFPANVHCHMLRHSIAMAMYKKKIPDSYIRDFLGHASLECVAIYAHADSEEIKEAIETANESFKLEPSNEKRWKGHEEELLAYCGLT